MTPSGFLSISTSRRPVFALLVGAVSLVCALQFPVAGITADETELVVLAKSQSALLHYPGLYRVAVGDAAVADVAVVSTREIILYARDVGSTDLYIWDDRGVHRLVISVTVDAPSNEAAESLSEFLGDDYRVVILGDTTLAVDGIAADQAALDRVNALVTGMSNGVKVINLVALNPPPPAAGPPVEEIAALLGPDFAVSMLGEGVMVVEGSPATAAEAVRARLLIAAFEQDAKMVDMIEDPVQYAPTATEERELLADAVGDDVSVRLVGGVALVIEGTVATDEDATRLASLIEALALNSPVLNETRVALPGVKQVLVRVKVVEMSHEDLDQVGVNWGNLGGGNAFVDQPFLVGQFGGRGFDSADLAAQISALEQNNHATILARPNILVNDGEEATIHVGGEVPIPVPQAGAGGAAVITVEYKEFGIKLMVQPTIMAEGDAEPRISLSLSPEVSSIDPASGITIQGISIPGFKTRKADTVVDVDPGSTLVIAGLIQRDVARIKRKIPFLGDIPIIGRLFRSKEFREGKTDLVIMVTPEILESE